MFNTKPRIGRELLDVPMGDMIRDMAFAIAEAQMRLDENSMEVAEMMGGLRGVTQIVAGEEKVIFEDSRVFFGKQKVTKREALTIKADSGYSAVATEIDGVTGAGVEDDDLVVIPARLSMLELGFTPTFYQFVDTIIEVKISIKYTQEGSRTTSVGVQNTNKSGNFSFGFRRGLSRKKNVTTSQVNSTYSQKYSYSAEGSSLLRTKLVPIPPPAILEERIEQLMEMQRQGELEQATE